MGSSLVLSKQGSSSGRMWGSNLIGSWHWCSHCESLKGVYSALTASLLVLRIYSGNGTFQLAGVEKMPITWLEQKYKWKSGPAKNTQQYTWMSLSLVDNGMGVATYIEFSSTFRLANAFQEGDFFIFQAHSNCQSVMFNICVIELLTVQYKDNNVMY